MRSRSRSGTATSGRSPVCALDLVCLTLERRDLLVLLAPGAAKAPRLPSSIWRGAVPLEAGAGALMRQVLGADVLWREQVGALVTGSHPDRAGLSIVYAALAARGAPAPIGTVWCDVEMLPANTAPRHRAAIGAAVAHLRNRMDHAPIAFRLLGPTFTLGDLQAVYEVLLSRRLHKASFRRALQAAGLVEPTDEWRSAGRGRPAQYFRYAPRRRKNTPRAVRFELLGT
jgi:8-oxo-dGTP diphosphatase